MNDIFNFIFLGIIQGFTEPLPISSSGHLVIFEQLLNMNIPGISFEAFINFGSTIAIIIYFKDTLIDLFISGLNLLVFIFKKFFKKNKDLCNKLIKENISNWEYIFKIIVATLPLVLIGFILVFLGYDGVENLNTVGFSLIITAIALFLVSNLKGNKDIKSLTYFDALIIGFFQAIAFLPGISRSGMCLVGALVVGLKTKEAFNFTFIMYVPASIGALLLSLIGMFISNDISSYFIGYIIAFLLAGIFTYLGLKLLKNLVIANRLYYFAIYCLLLGSSLIIFIK